jgi:hypothetical protein
MGIIIDNDVKNQKSTPALYSDVYANIPAFGQTGRLFFATDTNIIYRDTGSAWVVFLSQVSIPGGLSPIGTAGQYIKVNAGATALEYFTFNSTAVTNALGYTPVGGTGTSGTIPKFTASGTIGNSSLIESATYVSTTLKLAVGPTPGSTYALEVDGGINVATGHTIRKVGVDIFNTTNNGLPKFNTTTGTFSNSTISDDGSKVITSLPLFIGSNGTGNTGLEINRNLSTGAVSTDAFGFYNKGIITTDITNKAEYFATSVGSTGTFSIVDLYHFRSVKATTTGATITNQYGFAVDSTVIGATNNYAFYSNLASATGRWNFYANGTAPNYFGGRVLCNLTTAPSGTTMTSNNLCIYNTFGLQNNDWSAGSAGTALLFALTATSGATTGSISVRTAGGTGSGTLILNSGGGTVAIGTVASPAYNLQLGADSAGKPSTSTWTIVSDSRVKTDVMPYNKGLDEILAINPVEYKYNGKAGFDPEQGGIGIIAQEIKDILPETVNTYMAKLNEKDKKDTELFNFNSHAITFVLINAIKELKAEIELLKTN